MEYIEDYSRNYITPLSIPAALIELKISNVDKDLSTIDIFMIDSGADITCIRKQIFDILELEIISEEPIQGFGDGDDVTLFPSSYVCLEIPQLKIKKFFPVIIDYRDQDNILGRDFLKFLKTILDGPKSKYILSI
jgi:hypothetical protein